jgi:hypothetical protein
VSSSIDGTIIFQEDQTLLQFKGVPRSVIDEVESLLERKKYGKVKEILSEYPVNKTLSIFHK